MFVDQRFGLTVAMLLAAVTGCRHTLPGTHVEVIEKGGEKIYLTGAANMGTNKNLACGGAVQRTVAAIALRFAQDNSGIAEDVAAAVGVSDGEVFLQRFAKADALSAAVQDLEFDPIEHLCKATVRWKPPVFVKEAVLKYAEKLKASELGESSTSSVATGPAAVSPPPSGLPPTSAPPPPAAVGAPAPAAARAASCGGERERLARTLKGSQKAVDDFGECMRRKNDEEICRRFKAGVEQAKKQEDAAGQKLADCLNAGLSATLRAAIARELPGHAAVSVETTAAGNVLLWTFSPVEQTSFALELTGAGSAASRTPLAANQVQWVREQLGL